MEQHWDKTTHFPNSFTLNNILGKALYSTESRETHTKLLGKHSSIRWGINKVSKFIFIRPNKNRERSGGQTAMSILHSKKAIKKQLSTWRTLRHKMVSLHFFLFLKTNKNTQKAHAKTENHTVCSFQRMAHMENKNKKENSKNQRFPKHCRIHATFQIITYWTQQWFTSSLQGKPWYLIHKT